MELCNLEETITGLEFIGIAKHSESGEEFQVYSNGSQIDEDIRLGFYKHKKGKFYEVLGTTFNPENNEKLVVYKGLYLDEKRGLEALWVRPLKMFLDKDEHSIPRFRYV